MGGGGPRYWFSVAPQAQQSILNTTGKAVHVRNDWGEESLVAELQIDPERANLAGVTNRDVASSTAAGLGGYRLRPYWKVTNRFR